MFRHRGRVIADGADEFAPAQELQGGLDGALREACRFGELAQAAGDWFPFLASRETVKVEVNQIRRGLLVVTDDVSHQDIEDVVVDGDGLAKSRHGRASRKEELERRK